MVLCSDILLIFWQPGLVSKTVEYIVVGFSLSAVTDAAGGSRGFSFQTIKI